MKFRHLLPIAALSLGVAMICGTTGCGGGGGSSSGGSSMGVFVMDDFGDQFSQVWVTLFKIEASADGTNFQTLFEDTAGKSINVATLVNSAQFLGQVSAPGSGFTKVRVTIGDHLTLVPKAGGAAQSVPVDSSIPQANGQATLTFDVTAPGTHHDVMVDFDLAAFQMVGGKVVPHVKHGNDDVAHHDGNQAELEGIVSNLSATGFDLTIGGGHVVSVQTNADTQIFSSQQGTAATLANGQRVEVKGTVDPNTHVVLASTIKIDDNQGHGGDGHHHEDSGVEGAVASIDAAGKSFVVTLHDTDHFTPPSGTVTVQTNDSTVFEKPHSDHASFADVTVGAQVEASGTYDDTTNTLTATRVEIHMGH